MAPSLKHATPELMAAMNEASDAVDDAINALLPETNLPEKRLFDAMRYACTNGGKRFRPFLVMASAKLFGVNKECAVRVAAAVEFMHCYSLIHDDLPAMDDSPLRRGKPSVHIEFDEATAILAGDALQCLAFEVLAHEHTHADPRVRIELVARLAAASGCHGMAAGQMLDLIGENQTFDVGEISRLQRLKTGRLMAFCCEAGAILGKASPAHVMSLRNFAHDLGLAFQVTDDILDVEGDPEAMGKPANQDETAGKATFVSALGLDDAKSKAELLSKQAISHLNIFERRADTLRDAAYYVLRRHE